MLKLVTILFPTSGGVCGGPGGWVSTAGGCEDWETAVRGQLATDRRPNVTSQAGSTTPHFLLTSSHLITSQKL